MKRLYECFHSSDTKLQRYVGVLPTGYIKSGLRASRMESVFFYQSIYQSYTNQSICVCQSQLR